MTTQNVLSQSDLLDIKNALVEINNGLSQAELAKRAGINVDESVKGLLEYQDKLSKIKQVYFPND